MKQSETAHGMKHRIEELEEENVALTKANQGILSVEKEVQIKGKIIKIAKRPRGIAPITTIQALSINMKDVTNGSDALLLDRRRGGEFNNQGFWLGRDAHLHGYIPEVRRDTAGDYVLVFVGK